MSFTQSVSRKLKSKFILVRRTDWVAFSVTYYRPSDSPCDSIDKTIDSISTSPVSKDRCIDNVIFLTRGRSHESDTVEAVTEQEATTDVDDAYRWFHWQEHSWSEKVPPTTDIGRPGMRRSWPEDLVLGLPT